MAGSTILKLVPRPFFGFIHSRLPNARLLYEPRKIYIQYNFMI